MGIIPPLRQAAKRYVALKKPNPRKVKITPTIKKKHPAAKNNSPNIT